ncbi:hypothetical protein H2204_003136 [Knufia peltigerae]|uniref:aldehyde dehydrogenase (NAD(+)) n=1 Tax=Knufia peltigerae TaxID=1002370 RepID=A0AA38YA14_9EURO|nr:hypothetical protein H2204_003136 [Knufia peltigerae]
MPSNGYKPISFSTFANIVDGQPRKSSKSTFGVDPTTKQHLWEVPIASASDVDDAVVAAHRAFTGWKLTPWQERTEYLTRFKDAIKAHEEDLITLLCRETGKPRGAAQREVQNCQMFADWHINLPEPKGDEYDLADRKIIHRCVPLGVCAAICPWNFPVLLSLGKVLPALLMGNAIIVKPSTFTPYTTLKMVEIANLVFPPGLVQGLAGDEALGPALVEHPDIQKISFTGSTTAGKKVMAAAAKTLKRVTLEMGGNDPAIVLPDADIEKAAFVIARGAFANSGQVCIACKRIYAHSSIYQPFLEALVQATKSFTVDPTREEGLLIGPVQNTMQYEKVKTFFEDSKEKSYKFAYGSDAVPESAGGYIIRPAILDNPPDNSKIVSEEPFGPIVPVQRYETVDEVVRRANASEAGLGATVFGSDPRVLSQVASQLESGMVWINGPPEAKPEAQFGGVKQSGIGTEFGTLGVLAYCNVKTITTYK